MLKHIGLSKEVYSRVAMNAVMASPNILNCEPLTLRKALLQCAQLGLLPDGDAASLVPFKNRGVAHGHAHHRIQRDGRFGSPGHPWHRH